jgi:signal peptidase I
MLTTSLLVLVIRGSTVVLLLFSAWLLQLGARWARVPDVGYGRAVMAVFFMSVSSLLVRAVVSTLATPLSAILEGILGVLAAWVVVRWCLRTTFGKAIMAWLPTLIASAVGAALAVVIIRPFLFEAFTSATNAMAPTILGRHLRSTCPACGAIGYISSAGIDEYSLAEELGICGTCLRASLMPIANKTRFTSDSLLAAKFLEPRRWDLIVFRNPEDGSTVYVKRLVGLPGEEVAIRDGDVWIDGARAEKPKEIAGLVYAADVFSNGATEWGPVTLRADEFFVLGDFSMRAKDSRLWIRGAPGHPPYAVPQSYLVGVVTHIYWPPSRWRVFR